MDYISTLSPTTVSTTPTPSDPTSTDSPITNPPDSSPITNPPDSSPITNPPDSSSTQSPIIPTITIPSENPIYPTLPPGLPDPEKVGRITLLEVK